MVLPPLWPVVQIRTGLPQHGVVVEWNNPLARGLPAVACPCCFPSPLREAGVATIKKFARTVRSHRELLLNYFRARKEFSSGVIEGLNNNAKVTMRNAYGYRSFRIAELSLFHVLGKLPEPELANEFY